MSFLSLNYGTLHDEEFQVIACIGYDCAVRDLD